MKNPGKLQNSIKLLESLLGKKIILEASSDASRNLAVEALNALSDSLNMVKQNLVQAIAEVDAIGSQDIIMTKLRGMDPIIDSALTDIAESITEMTGMETQEDIMAESDEHGVEMNTDAAVKNIEDVKKFADKGVNVILTDDEDSYI